MEDETRAHSTDNSSEYKTGGWGAHSILIVCTLLYMINYMDRQVLAAVLEPMKQELGLSDTQAGALNTVLFIGMALFSFPAAFMVDRWSRRKAIAVMAFIWSIFTFVTGMGKGFWGVFLPRSIVGIGEAGFAAGGTAMITAAYPEKSRSKMMGIFNIAIPLGAALGMILGGYISQNYGGWRTPFFIFAVPGILLGSIALLLKDYKTVDELDGTGQKAGFFASAFSLFKIPTLRWVYLGFAMQNIMGFTFLGWVPAYLMRTRGITEDKAGMVVGVIGLMAIIGSLAGGILADRWQKKNVRGRMYLPVICVSLSALFYLAGVILEFDGVGYACGIAYGILIMAGVPALSAVTQDVVRPSLKGVAWGMNVFCMFMLGGGWGPLLVGAISDALGGGVYGLKVALIMTSAGGILAGILFGLGSRHYPADVERVKHLRLEEEV